MTFRFRIAVLLLALLPLAEASAGALSAPKKSPGDPGGNQIPPRRPHKAKHTASARAVAAAVDAAKDDVSAGEDPMVREAAVSALGSLQGTLLAIDPATGRILAMVNQKLALSEGAQPCSTIKLAVALAALNENVVTPETWIRTGSYWDVNLTEALAMSNNAYFEEMGRRLGFAKVSEYARQFGLGELAGLNIAGEHSGIFPTHEPAASQGGVGRVCSYGEGISMTPLQLGALVSAIANGGTLYFLQHPSSAEEVAAFHPQIKRHLEIAPAISDMSMGMMGAVIYGTARSLRRSFTDEEVLGKTGTCSSEGARLGWFASWTDSEAGHIVVVVLLRGGASADGPKAAEVAGKFYRSLYDHNFFSAAAAVSAR